MNQPSEELLGSVESTAAWLKRLSDDIVRTHPAPGKWSVQEIVGHLIDSAANHHQRFVRAQYEDVLVFPMHDTDDWIAAQDYQAAPWRELVELWLLYNRHLARVIRRIPETRLSVECRIGSRDPVSLQWMIENYVFHLQDHIQQMRERAALFGDRHDDD